MADTDRQELPVEQARVNRETAAPHHIARCAQASIAANLGECAGDLDQTLHVIALVLNRGSAIRPVNQDFRGHAVVVPGEHAAFRATGAYALLVIGGTPCVDKFNAPGAELVRQDGHKEGNLVIQANALAHIFNLARCRAENLPPVKPLLFRHIRETAIPVTDNFEELVLRERPIFHKCLLANFFVVR